MAEPEVRGIDAARVTDWLCKHVGELAPPLRFERIPGGHSNLTYRVSDNEGRLCVLRRPPLGAVLATAHDMGREHRIISALAQSDVPVPPALGLCKDESVNGAPFYVMDFVEGDVLATAQDALAHTSEQQRGPIGESLIDVLTRLHAVDIDAIGLGDLARREDYLGRQLRRWHTQWERSKTRELPDMDKAYHLLLERRPEQQGATIAHGDYRLGNMITRDARIVAVLDWELCTLGDPLADVAYLVNHWIEPGERGAALRGGAGAPSAVPGFPDRDELLRRYRERTGRDLGGIDYYCAFQFWRSAAIVEGVLARYLKGVMGGDADTDAFRAQVDGLAAAALERLEARGEFA